jgi:hypothetical protein
MNKTETAQLLTMASAIDNRTVGVETVEAWFMVIGDLDYKDASEALFTHFKTSGEYFMPRHIVDGVKLIDDRRKWELSKLRADFTVALNEGGRREELIKDPKYQPLGIES